jgi:hypothetical protein
MRDKQCIERMCWNRMWCTECFSFLVVIIDSFIVALNLLQKKARFETFLGLRCCE